MNTIQPPDDGSLKQDPPIDGNVEAFVELLDRLIEEVGDKFTT